MARKRISEEDLLNFRKQAGELAREVEAKYEKLDEARRAEIEPEPTGEFGVLLIHDAAMDNTQLRRFSEKLGEMGIVSVCADLSGYAPRDRFDKTPLWQRWLEQTQDAYQRLRERCEKAMVLGTGLSVPLACVIAEQYPVDALALVGGGLKREGMELFPGTEKKTSFQMARLAKNNLFSVVCPVLCFVPENCAPYSAASADMFSIASRSEDVRMEKFPGTDAVNIWTNCENSLLDAIMNFFSGE